MVEPNHYTRAEYLERRRFSSYGAQLAEILQFNPCSILEIGIGNGIVSNILADCGLKVATLDCDIHLGPDVAASVTELPLKDSCFDLVACFEVLEHLPFEEFSKCLSELCRVTKRTVLLSVPDVQRFYALEVRLPYIGCHKWSLSVPRIFREVARCPEHHWEIGERRARLKKVKRIVESAGFAIERTYRLWEYPYHRFFALQKLQKYKR